MDVGKHGYVYGEITEKGVQIQFCPLSCREYRNLVLESDTDMTEAEMEDWLLQQIAIGDEVLPEFLFKFKIMFV